LAIGKCGKWHKMAARAQSTMQLEEVAGKKHIGKFVHSYQKKPKAMFLHLLLQIM